MFERMTARDLAHTHLIDWELRHIGHVDHALTFPDGTLITKIGKTPLLSGWHVEIQYQIQPDPHSGHPGFTGSVLVPGDATVGVEV